MRLVHRSLVLPLLAALSLLSATVAAAQPLAAGPDVATTVREALAAQSEARVLILLRDPVSAKAADADRVAAIAQAQATILAVVPRGELRVLRRYTYVPALVAHVTPAALVALQARPEVAAVHLDQRTQGHLVESVAAVAADQVQATYGLTGQGVAVAVIDSGVDTDHPDLSDDLVAQHCFTDGGCPPGNTDEGASAEDQNGHGTNVAGIITSRGVVAARGFAPAARIAAVRVLGADNTGWVSDWVAGLDWVRGQAAAHNIRLVNMSLGTYTLYAGTCDAQLPTVAAAVNLVTAQGIAIFASSGNAGSSTALSAPACIGGVIAVGATYDTGLGREPDSGTYTDLFGSAWPGCANPTTSALTITCFTNSSSKLSILAPGALVTSSGLGGGVATYIGTSQAAPAAAGVAALLLQARPSLTPAQLDSLLRATGTPVTDARNGLQFPLINALSAARSLLSGPTPTPAPRRVSGQVDLQGRGNESGARVAVGGQEVTTGADGRFEILVPPGQYTTTAGRVGYLGSETPLVVAGVDVALPPVTLRGGDANADRGVNLFDLVLISSNYGRSTAVGDARADINGDGLIGLLDLTLVGSNYGKAGPQVWGVDKRAAGGEEQVAALAKAATEGLRLIGPKVVKAGEDFEVRVLWVGSSSPPDGIDITITFDMRRVVPLVAPEPGDWLDPALGFVARAEVDVEPGVARLVAVRLAGSATAGREIARLRLRAVAHGPPDVRLDHVEVAGAGE